MNKDKIHNLVQELNDERHKRDVELIKLAMDGKQLFKEYSEQKEREISQLKKQLEDSLKLYECQNQIITDLKSKLEVKDAAIAERDAKISELNTEIEYWKKKFHDLELKAIYKSQK